MLIYEKVATLLYYPVKNKLDFLGQVCREMVKMSRLYTCNYCQSNHTGKEALYEHIHNTPSCSSMHNTRRGSRRQRDVERRQTNRSRNNTEPRRDPTPPPRPPRDSLDLDVPDWWSDIPQHFNWADADEEVVGYFRVNPDFNTFTNLTDVEIPEDVNRAGHPEGEDEPSEGELTCVICMTNKSQIISTRCGHLCCCVGCSKRLYQRHDKCPKCREPWDNLMRVFS